MSPKLILINFRTGDGIDDILRFSDIKDARRWAHSKIGAHPDMGINYAVGQWGDQVIEPLEGCTLEELFPPG